MKKAFVGFSASTREYRRDRIHAPSARSVFMSSIACWHFAISDAANGEWFSTNSFVQKLNKTIAVQYSRSCCALCRFPISFKNVDTSTTKSSHAKTPSEMRDFLTPSEMRDFLRHVHLEVQHEGPYFGFGYWQETKKTIAASNQWDLIQKHEVQIVKNKTN